MNNTPIGIIDLNFQGRKQAIAAYLIKHSWGLILIECGPGSTLPTLEAALVDKGYTFSDVTHVLLTHIHLDHAGAAGFLARQGAQIFVHSIGAPHLLNPEKLLASANRIYGDEMDTLWGDFLSVPEERLNIVDEANEIEIGKLRFNPIITPGHAEHHIVYLFEEICFAGDIAGVRISGIPFLGLPMPPPELNLDKWRESIARLKQEKFNRIAPTHFGIFDNPDWHLGEVDKNLESVLRWLNELMPTEPSNEEVHEKFTALIDAQFTESEINEKDINIHEVFNPRGMSADGLIRYWKKFRLLN